MPSDLKNVNRLMKAAWDGISAELVNETATGEDVVNTCLAMAAGAVRYACALDEGMPVEAVAKNREVIRAKLQRLILEYTADDGKVM